jgi:hypothetical protein
VFIHLADDCFFGYRIMTGRKRTGRDALLERFDDFVAVFDRRNSSQRRYRSFLRG